MPKRNTSSLCSATTITKRDNILFTFFLMDMWTKTRKIKYNCRKSGDKKICRFFVLEMEAHLLNSVINYYISLNCFNAVIFKMPLFSLLLICRLCKRYFAHWHFFITIIWRVVAPSVFRILTLFWFVIRVKVVIFYNIFRVK